MIKDFVDRFMEGKDDLRSRLAGYEKYGWWEIEYRDIVREVIATIGDDDMYGDPDPDRVHEIDDGHYQGTLVYVIAGNGYQPYNYWYVMVSYGSCSGCDTLEAAKHGGDTLNDLMTLALHIVQGLRKMDECEA